MSLGGWELTSESQLKAFGDAHHTHSLLQFRPPPKHDDCPRRLGAASAAPLAVRKTSSYLIATAPTYSTWYSAMLRT